MTDTRSDLFNLREHYAETLLLAFFISFFFFLLFCVHVIYVSHLSAECMFSLSHSPPSHMITRLLCIPESVSHVKWLEDNFAFPVKGNESKKTITFPSYRIVFLLT